MRGLFMAMAISIMVIGSAMGADEMHPDGDSTTAKSIASEGRDVATIVRHFDSAPMAVWRAWTESEQMRRWFGSDPQGTVIAASADVRPGGNYSVTFADGDGTQHTASGKYLEVEPYSRLVFSWHWKSEAGVTSMVTVLLKPDGKGTIMHFQHAGIGYGSSHNFEKGWQDTFDKLERVLVARDSR